VRRTSSIERGPEWIVAKSFLLAVVAGTYLLWLPWANRTGRWTDPLTALFTAASATCVTGLTVVDIGTYYSRFGQLVILALIQVGGLGIMTLGTFLLVLMGRRLGMRDEFVLMDSLGYDRIRGLRSLLHRTVLFALAFESLGALMLALRLILAHDYPVRRAVYHGVFHAVSAFCNAGFSLNPDSVVRWQDDPVMLLVLAALIVLGGLGFLVLYDLSSMRFWRRGAPARGRLTLHTRVVLKATVALIAGGWALIALLEWNGTLAHLGLRDRLVVAFFQSVTPRTAGFNAVDMAAVHPLTLFATIGLMFVGGAPASAAGGVKITTLVVLSLVAVSMVRGRQDVVTHTRTVPPRVVREALSIFLLAVGLVVCTWGLLMWMERPPLLSPAFSASDELLFETVSAFGTVGLSVGITPYLSALGKLLIVAVMYIGRVGPLTLALTVGRKELTALVRYPEEDVVVG
jgi:trk system potassium uptake protein TrkH